MSTSRGRASHKAKTVNNDSGKIKYRYVREKTEAETAIGSK